jgi:hypothetical protein
MPNTAQGEEIGSLLQACHVDTSGLYNEGNQAGGTR